MEKFDTSPTLKDVQLEIEKTYSQQNSSDNHTKTIGRIMSETAEQSDDYGYNLVKDKEMRVIKPPQRFGQANLNTFALTITDDTIHLEPKNYKKTVEVKNQ